MKLNSNAVRVRQVVDWSAAVWAGLIAGIAFLLINIILTAISGGYPWLLSRLIASIVMGSRALPPPVGFDFFIFFTSLIVHLPLSILFACLIATVIHRWGLMVGILGGGLLGLFLYGINLYTFEWLFPGFLMVQNWVTIVSHIVFGGLAGGIYEALEVEEFVPIDE